MFCFREKSIGLTVIQQNEKSTQRNNSNFLSRQISFADKLDNIIEMLKDLDRLNTIVDILCPTKKGPSPVKRATGRTVQPRGVAPISPLTGETRDSEHVPQPVQRQMQPHKHVVQVEVHTTVEPTEPEDPIKS